MSKEYRSTSFKAGNSVAVRFPRPLGLEAGAELLLREEGGRYIVERAQQTGKRIDLTGIAGSIPGLKLLTPEDRLFEERELDWEGKLLRRE